MELYVGADQTTACSGWKRREVRERHKMRWESKQSTAEKRPKTYCSTTTLTSRRQKYRSRRVAFHTRWCKAVCTASMLFHSNEQYCEQRECASRLEVRCVTRRTSSVDPVHRTYGGRGDPRKTALGSGIVYQDVPSARMQRAGTTLGVRAGESQ